jgi:hypothetical protein
MNATASSSLSAPSRVAALDSVTPQPSVAADPTFTEPQRPTESEAEPPQPHELPREHWDAVGLIVLENGTVTHALGDDYAQKILTGEISFEDAVARQRRAERDANNMVASNYRRSTL